MQTIGLIGGMSWESSAEYYRLLNRAVRERLGGQHSAKTVMVSVDFHEIEALQRSGDWDRLGTMMADAARTLERAGVDFALLCTNTMHKLWEPMTAATPLPFIHIADATAERVVAAGVKRVGLLGTRFTMEQDFYRARFEAHGLEVLVPETDDRDTVHRVIYDELCLGDIREPSRQAYVDIIGRLRERGAQAVILGCTEIPLLIGPEHSPLPTFDTTRIHVEAAVDLALG
ncbi:MAG TPA: aspartate/glutamate racemase family protein [Xanthomonadales bacterium]|nr:aspartate/glutamate racemase family protein [Xanthomonadales bacterium]